MSFGGDAKWLWAILNSFGSSECCSTNWSSFSWHGLWLFVRWCPFILGILGWYLCQKSRFRCSYRGAFKGNSGSSSTPLWLQWPTNYNRFKSGANQHKRLAIFIQKQINVYLNVSQIFDHACWLLRRTLTVGLQFVNRSYLPPPPSRKLVNT